MAGPCEARKEEQVFRSVCAGKIAAWDAERKALRYKRGLVIIWRPSPKLGMWCIQTILWYECVQLAGVFLNIESPIYMNWDERTPHQQGTYYHEVFDILCHRRLAVDCVCTNMIELLGCTLFTPFEHERRVSISHPE